MTSPIIIDTDPGIDDALAMAFSFSASLPVMSITTVYGNSGIGNVTKNAGYITKSLGAQWSIYQGAGTPLVGDTHLAKSHGKTGLGDIIPRVSEIAAPANDVARDALIQQLESNDELTLFCLGPLTNIAQIFIDRPDLASKINKMIIMGGAFREKGNVTKFAEFNCYNDPAGFQIVMDTARSRKIHTTVIPVEVCRNVVLTYADVELIKHRSLLPNIDLIVGPFIDYYMNDEIHGGYDGAVMYDVLIPLYYQEPKLFTVQRVDISVSQTGPKKGQTTCINSKESSIELCIDINADKAKKIIIQTLIKSRINVDL